MAKTLRSWHGTRPVTPERKDEGSFITRLERRFFGDELFLEIQGDMEAYAFGALGTLAVWLGGTGVNERFEVSDPEQADRLFDDIRADLEAAGYTGVESDAA